MQSNIEVRFLTPEEMQNAFKMDVRYENVKRDNLGFADPVKNKVFVRAGLDADLTKYLLNHELNHLFELEGSDEDENGIRHKNSGSFWHELGGLFYPESNAKTVYGTPYEGQPSGAGGVGGLLGSIFGSMLMNALIPGMGGIGEAVGAGLGNMTGSDIQEEATTGKPQWGQNAMQGLKNAATGSVGSTVGNVAGAIGESTPNMGWLNQGVGGLTPSNLIGQSAGTGTSMAFGEGTPTYNFGSMFNTNPSGFSMTPQIQNPGGFIPGSVGGGSQGTGGQSGSLAQMAGNAGLGQGGIALGGQMGMPNTGQTGSNTGTGQGGNMANMGMEKSVGFNPFNGGSISFGNPSNVENIW